MTSRKSCCIAYVLLVTGLLTGCGGGESGTGVGGTNPKSAIHTGVITGFGSVFVTGIEFMTPAASVVLDGADGTENQLALGMVVTVKGTVDANGTTGTATSIEYQDELEGIVLSNSIPSGATSGSLDVMGRTVNVDTSTQFSSSVGAVSSVDQVVAGNVVEVSGYSSGAGDIHATRIEVKRASHADEDIEVKGVISNLTATSFTIGTLTVSYPQAATLNNGWYVEVHSTAGISGGELTASKVEILSESGGKTLTGSEGDSVKQEGVITSALANSQFAVNGIAFQISDSTVYENGAVTDLILGGVVDVEATVSSTGTLLATQVEFKLASNLEAEGTVTSVNATAGTFILFGKTIVVTAATILKDEQSQIRDFGIKNLAVSDRVKLDGYAQNGTTWVATQLERVSPTSNPASLAGPLELNVSDYTVGGIVLDFALCSGCLSQLPSLLGTDIELEGSWTGTVFSVTAID